MKIMDRQDNNLEKEFYDDYEFIYNGMKNILKNHYDNLSYKTNANALTLANEIMNEDLSIKTEDNIEKVLSLYLFLEDFFNNRKVWIVNNIGEGFFKFYKYKDKH